MSKPYNSWKVLIGSDAIHRRVKELAKIISGDLGNEPFTVVCILDGGLFFGVDLLRNFEHETKANQVGFEVVKARSYVGTRSGKIDFDHLNLSKDKIHGKQILLIDDILETGQTLNRVCKFIKGFEPADLKIAAFLKKNRQRTFPIEVDYFGFEVEDPSLWLVGYGLDDDGRYRNLKDIRIMPQG